jgi:hypothetical protein
MKARARAVLVLVGLVCCGASAVASAQMLGRLFSTAAERDALDGARERYDPNRQEVIYKPGVVAPSAPAKPPPLLPSLTVNGLVVRSGGRTAAWVNGTPLGDGESTADGIELRSDGRSVKFILPSGSNTASIRPGQLLDPNAGKVREVFARPKAKSEVKAQPAGSSADSP